MSKVRRVDFHPAEYMAGTSKLSLEERGAYWSVCSLIYDHGGPIDDDDRWIAAAIFVSVRKWKPIKAALIAKSKLHLSDGKLSNGRCETEIQKAVNRIKGAEKGAQARWGKSDQPEVTNPREVPRLSVDSPSSGSCATDIPTAIDSHVSSINSELVDAAAYAAPYANQEPRTTKAKEEEESPPQTNGKRYAFSGKIIRLTEADFDQWQASYSAIPDLRGQLQSDDDYYDRTLTGKARADWFRRESQKLCNLHQKLLAGNRSYGANLNESF